MAMVSVPPDLTAEGTVAAIAELATCGGMTVVGSDEVAAEAAVVDELDELDEQAEATNARIPSAAAVTIVFMSRDGFRTGELPIDR